MYELACILLISPLLLLVGWALVRFVFGHCPRCGTELEPHKMYPNVMVCPRCKYVQIGD